MRLILVILALMGLAVIGLAVAIGTGALNIGLWDPAVPPRPAAAAAARQEGAAEATTPVAADDPLVVPPPPLLSDRAIVLEPEAARLAGKVMLVDTTFSGEKKPARREERRPGKRPVYPLLTGFADPQDLAAWTFAVPEAGRYSATVDYSLPGKNEGKNEGKDAGRYILAIAGEKLPFTLDVTRGPTGFQLADVGTAHLPAGQAHLTLGPESKVRGGAALNVRGIRLFPAE